MANEAKTPQTNYMLLDLIRFFAALLVVFYHLGYLHWTPNWSGSVSENLFWTELAPFAELLRWGWVGVPIFFVLSGFVVAFSASGRSAGVFIENRVLRLYPGAVLCSCVTGILMFHYGTLRALPLFNSLVLWPLGPWISGVYWTLGIEMVFYALMAICIWRHVSILKLGIALSAASGIFWLLKLIDYAVGLPIRDLLLDFNGQWGSLTLLPNGCYFAIGIFLWARTKGLNLKIYLPFMAISIFTAILALVNAGKFYVAEQGGARWQMFEPAALWLTVLSVMIFAIHFNKPLNEKLSRFGTYTRNLGMMTYPLYLVHDEIGFRLMLSKPSWDGRIILLVAVATGLVAAYLVFRVETPFRNFLRHKLNLNRTRNISVAQLP